MSNTLRLQVLLDTLDRASGPLKRITGAGKGTVAVLKQSRDALRGFDQLQKQVGEFRKLKQGSQESGRRMHDLQARIKDVARQMRESDAPTAELTRQFKSLTKQAGALKTQESEQAQKLQQLRTRLAEAGVNTRTLASADISLRDGSKRATSQLQRETIALRHQSEQAGKLRLAREKLARSQALGAHMAIAGYASLQGGRHVIGAIAPGIQQASEWAAESQRFATLGLGDKALKDAQKLATSMHYAGTSAVDNLELIRDASAVFANEHHAAMALPLLAKMKFANDTLYGQDSGEARTRQFQDMLKVIDLRGGTLSKGAFELQANSVQKVFNATAGRVAPQQWRELIQRGGVAAKQMDNKAFYFGMEPLVQEMGGASTGSGLMSMYQNLYQGKSSVRAAQEMGRVGLLDPKKVEYNKIGMIKQIKAGALRGGDLFTKDPQKWLETVMLPALAKHGITSRKDVLNEIGAIVGNRRGASLMAAMYTQRVQIARSRKLSEGADDINAAAGKAENSPAGRLIQLQKQRDNLYLTLGNELLPTYIAALRKLTRVLKVLDGFAKRHPALAKGIVLVAGGMGVLMVAAGGLMVALGGVVGQIALLRFGLASLRIMGVPKGLRRLRLVRKRGLRGLGRLGKRGLGSLGRLSKRGARATGRGLKALGRGGTRGALAALRGVKWAFKGLGRGVKLLGQLGKTGALKALSGLRLAFMGVGRAVIWMGRAALANPLLIAIGLLAAAAYLFYTRWDDIKSGCILIWNQLSDACAALWANIKAMAAKIVGWVSDKIDWVEKKWKKLKKLMGDIGKAADKIGTNTIKVLLDKDQSVSARGGAGALMAANFLTSGASNTVAAVINVFAAPGMDEHQVANEVKRKFDAQKRADAARNRSKLRDTE